MLRLRALVVLALAGCLSPGEPADSAGSRVWKTGARVFLAAGSLGLSELAQALEQQRLAYERGQLLNRIEFEQALDYHVGTLTRAEAEGIWGPPSETREALSPVVAFWREPDRRGALESPFGGLVRPLEMPCFELVLEFDDESRVLVNWELVLAPEAPRRWQIYRR